MFIGLKDFDIDIFLRLDDSNIYLYYTDFETVPNIVKDLPLGSFDDEGKLKFTTIDMDKRINIGLEFLHRDLYAEYNPQDMSTIIRIDRFLEQFGNIPEVVSFFDPYISLCESDTPPSWCTNCAESNNNNDCSESDGRPNWCNGCSEDKPNGYGNEYNTYSIGVPLSEFIKIDPTTGKEDYSDIYFMIVVYFNGVYRTTAKNTQEFGIYNTLTDIDFELNNYSMILNIKEFFTKEFIYFLKCIPGSIPFANDYGTEIKLVVQTKNFIVRQLEIESEIQFFITKFNTVYGDLVKIKDIHLESQESDLGADSWVISVYADIQQERLIYRLEI